MPSLSPRPPSPHHRRVCVRCSQPPGKGTARVWLSQRGFGRRGWRNRVRRSAYPGTATGPTETPASCRSVAEVSFVNGGFVARTRFGVFGQAMSRYGSRTLRRSFVRKGVGVHKEPHERVEGCLPTRRRNSLPARRHPTSTGPARSGIHPSAWNEYSRKLNFRFTAFSEVRLRP